MSPCGQSQAPLWKDRASPSVAGVIERFAPAFWARYGERIPLDQGKALQAILQCRTAALGGHRYACSCGHQHHAFHSCQHRLCPRCGKADTQEWVGSQLARLLPVSYYMVTFTLPAQLHRLVHQRREAIEAFMQCSGEALAQLLADPHHGGFHRSGFFGVYQSWTQDMRLHPHVHYIVPAVGLDSRARLKRPRRSGFLIYAGVLAKRLRTLLSQQLHDQGLIDTGLFWKLVKMDWNASVDRAGSGENAVKYLGQYVHRSVISDQRILRVDQEHVHIRTRDRETGENKICVLEGVEFVRRFLQHALPARFHRIRYRGFLHARAKETLDWLRLLLIASFGHPKPSNAKAESTPPTCPRCGRPMQSVQSMPRAPPVLRNQCFFQRLNA